MVNAWSLPSALLVCAGLVSGQQAAPGHDWALETPNWGSGEGPPGYIAVPDQDGVGSSFYFVLHWQPGWDRSDQTLPQATALRIVYRMEGDRVRVEPFVVLRPFDHDDMPSSLEGVPQESAGVYFVRFGELVVLEGLAKFGMEPWPMRLVSNKPQVPASPQIINNAPSIRVEAVDQDRTFYKLSLRNLSSKDINALSIGAPHKDGSIGMTTQGAPAIAAGAQSQVLLGKVPADEAAAAPPIVIDAVVFADSSFEGSVEKVAEIEADRLGRWAQWKRIAGILQAIQDGEKQDTAADIATLRSRVNALPEKVEPPMIETIVNRYPDLSLAARISVENQIHLGLRNSKQNILHDVKEYERQAADRKPLFRSWCEAEKNQLEAR